MFRQSVAMALAASLALGSPTLIGSCSFMAVQRPRRDERGRLEPAGCTTRMFAPGADGIITAALLVGTVTTVATADDSTTTAAPTTSKNDQLLAGLVLAALFGISAIYGAVSVSTCREASGMVRVPKQTSDERRAEEAAEEAAVQARWRARANAAAKAAADAGANPDAGAAPDSSP